MRYIYGVYQGNVCIYVGQSKDPKGRFQAHIRRFRKKRRGLRLQVLRSVKTRHATRIEKQVIKAFFRRGEAVENITHASRYFRFFVNGVSTGSHETTRQYLGCSFWTYMLNGHVLIESPKHGLVSVVDTNNPAVGIKQYSNEIQIQNNP